MTERYTVGGVTTWRSYFVVDGKIVAERFSSGSTVNMQYFVLDHLGSVATIGAINPTTGAVTTTQQAYDAWGKMRFPTTGADDMTCSLPPASPSTRGFTNQGQMADVCLDNYNARIYDPQIGRFMAADTEIPDAGYSQSYNRYTYVENGPLSYTDPTGHEGNGPSGCMLCAAAASGDQGMAIAEMNSSQDTIGQLAAVWSGSTQSGSTSGVGPSGSGVTTQPAGPQATAAAVTPATSSGASASNSGANPLANTPGDQAANQTTSGNASNGAPLLANAGSTTNASSANSTRRCLQSCMT
jgi:RHS repeat-associated protein